MNKIQSSILLVSIVVIVIFIIVNSKPIKEDIDDDTPEWMLREDTME